MTQSIKCPSYKQEDLSLNGQPPHKSWEWWTSSNPSTGVGEVETSGSPGFTDSHSRWLVSSGFSIRQKIRESAVEEDTASLASMYTADALSLTPPHPPPSALVTHS